MFSYGTTAKGAGPTGYGAEVFDRTARRAVAPYEWMGSTARTVPVAR